MVNVRRLRFSHLVEKHNDRFADPAENLHLCLNVGRFVRCFRDIDEVENDT